MRGARQLFLQATMVLLAGVWLVPPTAYAQGADAAGEESRPEQRTRRTPAMRERVYNRLSEAQECAEADDIACAMDLLTQVREMSGLNSYETAQMWNFYAFIYFGEDNFPEAIRAYAMVLEQPDLPLGMETTTMFTLSQLYFQEEQYNESLAMLDRWFEVAENPAPSAYILRAQLFYSMERYAEGIEPVNMAIEVAREQGRELQENWYRLLNVFYYELEDYPNVIRVLRTIIDTWPKREYFVQLSAMYGEEGDDARQIALYETAYEAGWLVRGNELVQMAQLLLSADIPIKAAKIMEAGLSEGTIEPTETNWRILAQALQLAQEDEQAIPALDQAAHLSESGELHVRLAQSYQNLARWDECIEASRTALSMGDLRREDQANMILGACLFELKEYGQARTAFRRAAEDSRSRTNAQSWISFVDSEEERDEQLRLALRR